MFGSILYSQFLFYAVGTVLPVSAVKEEKVREHRETEKQNMDKILDEYLQMCNQMGVIFLSFFLGIPL